MAELASGHHLFASPAAGCAAIHPLLPPPCCQQCAPAPKCSHVDGSKGGHLANACRLPHAFPRVQLKQVHGGWGRLRLATDHRRSEPLSDCREGEEGVCSAGCGDISCGLPVWLLAGGQLLARGAACSRWHLPPEAGGAPLYHACPSPAGIRR